MTTNKHSVSLMLLRCSLSPNFHKLWYMHRMEFYFNHLKCEAVLHVLMWNDCQDIVSIHEKKHKARKVCIVHYHFYFSLPQIFINIYVYIYVHTHTHTHIYIYTHIHTHTECLWKNT